MKLYRVLLGIVFSCVTLSVGVVGSISASDHDWKSEDSDGPYFAQGIAVRFSDPVGVPHNVSPGNTFVAAPLAHVRLKAIAKCTSEEGRNGYYVLQLSGPAGFKKKNRVGSSLDGKFHEELEETRYVEPNECFAAAIAGGEVETVSGSQSKKFEARALDSVGARPAAALAPVPVILTPPEPGPEPDPEPGIGGGCSSNTPGMYSLSGSYTAVPGDTHEVCLVTDAPYSQVYWYVKVPWDTMPGRLGTLEETDTGDGTTKEATFSYTFPSRMPYAHSTLIWHLQSAPTNGEGGWISDINNNLCRA